MQTICQERFMYSLRTTRKIRLITTLVLAYASSCAFSAETGQWKFISGIDYSTGDYGDVSDTAMLYVPFGIGYAYHNWSGKIITGWLAIDGPGNLVDDGVILPGTGTDRSESGIADTWAAATYELDTIPPEFGFLDLTGKIKFPTADENKGLGTGKTDYALQADYMYAAGKLTPMATLGYKIKGDPSGYDLNNVIYWSVGADWRCSDTTHIGASLDYQQASTDGVDDPLEVFTYLNHKTGDQWSLSPYLYFGLSDSSPDLGVGLQFVYKP